MEQPAINQRLNFLVEKLADSVRSFSISIDESTSNAHKYIKGTTRPSPEFLEKVLLRFGDVNARWLLTGEGEPFLNGATDAPIVHQTNKKNNGPIIGAITGDAHFTNLSDCAKANANLRTENELLRSQLVDKERLIQLYERQQSK